MLNSEEEKSRKKVYVVLYVETDHTYEIVEKRLLLKINDTINTAWAHFFKKCFKVSIIYEGSERRCKNYVDKLKQNERVTRMFLDETIQYQKPSSSTQEETILDNFKENLSGSISNSNNNKNNNNNTNNSYNSINNKNYGDFKKNVQSNSTFNDILRQSTYLINELSEKSNCLSNKISSISTPSKFSKNSSVVSDNDYKTVMKFFLIYLFLKFILP